MTHYIFIEIGTISKQRPTTKLGLLEQAHLSISVQLALDFHQGAYSGVPGYHQPLGEPLEAIIYLISSQTSMLLYLSATMPLLVTTETTTMKKSVSI